MYTYSAKVLNVVDGDTVDLEVDLGFSIKREDRFRLYGIDTPEIRAKDHVEKAAGLAAKARLKDLIEGKDVIINTIKDKTDKYGRYLAVITIEDESQLTININEKLVEEGLAKSYFGGSR